MLDASTSRRAAEAAADSLFARFGSPVAIWMREQEGDSAQMAECRGLNAVKKAAVRRDMRDLATWPDLSDQARDALKMQFGRIVGSTSVQAAGGRFVTILVGKADAETQLVLDMVSGGLDLTLTCRAALVGLKRREEEFDTALAWTAHEIKGPLLATKLTLSHVLSRGRLDQAQRRLLSRSEETLERLAGDVQHILCWASSDGTGALDRKPIDLAGLIRAAVSWILTLEEQERVILDLQEGIEIHADGTHLRGALANVVRNALDYSDTESEVRVSLSAHGSQAVVAVTNAGSLPSCERAAIFSRFARGSAGTVKPSASGLGLFISRRVVQAHSGRISVECRGGETTFSVVLPRG
jgi:signal transduction histidine kinase